MVKKSWLIIDDHAPEPPPDLDKAKAWLNDTFYGREGLIDLEVRQTPWHPDDLMAKLNVDPFNNALVDHLVAGNQFYPPKPEEPEPDEPTVPLEQIVKEYAEAVGELTGQASQSDSTPARTQSTEGRTIRWDRAQTGY